MSSKLLVNWQVFKHVPFIDMWANVYHCTFPCGIKLILTPLPVCHLHVHYSAHTHTHTHTHTPVTCAVFCQTMTTGSCYSHCQVTATASETTSMPLILTYVVMNPVKADIYNIYYKHLQAHIFPHTLCRAIPSPRSSLPHKVCMLRYLSSVNCSV